MVIDIKSYEDFVVKQIEAVDQWFHEEQSKCIDGFAKKITLTITGLRQFKPLKN